jgi:putative ubiquitin-RnfH superfamily antitoxin RatB of RatAB toxin-antitoxin module
MAHQNKRLTIEVVYLTPAKQRLLVVDVEEGCTIEMAIQCSGILNEFPEIDLTTQRVGVFSKKRNLFDKVFDGDRIEIYRSLIIDPKEARRKKAKS